MLGWVLVFGGMGMMNKRLEGGEGGNGEGRAKELWCIGRSLRKLCLLLVECLIVE